MSVKVSCQPLTHNAPSTRRSVKSHNACCSRALHPGDWPSALSSNAITNRLNVSLAMWPRRGASREIPRRCIDVDSDISDSIRAVEGHGGNDEST